ncbi:MAG: type II secretion system F family protein [Candidatus Chisholmbacteria bacterium]|nr:type II secretion system F family protein [Candidatus Chisholmbacteria bacterium]
MNRWQFRAKDEQGKTVKGTVEAQDEKGAVVILRGRKLLVMELKVVRGRAMGILKWFNRVKSDEVVSFTRQLATMITAGLPVTEALSVLEMQGSPAMGVVLGEVRRDVEGGLSLAEALKKRPQFGGVYVALVRAGEAGGVLDQVLKRLADNLEKQREFRNKTKGAFIYPAIVVTGMVIVGGVMMVFVMPKLTAMYADFGVDLPGPTRILISISRLAGRWWWLWGAAAAGLVVGGRAWSKTSLGGKRIDGWLFRLPVVGNLRKELMFTEFTRTLALLVGAGVSILEGLRIAGLVVGSPIYRSKIEKVTLQVEKGFPLAASLAVDEGFPRMLSQMIAVGEETGKLEEVLNKLSAYFEEIAENKIRGLTTAIEPLIMILLGVGVGFLIVAVIMPIYNLTSKF